MQLTDESVIYSFEPLFSVSVPSARTDYTSPIAVKYLHSANLQLNFMTVKRFAYLVLFIRVLKINPFCTVEQNNVRMPITKMSYVVRM